jgi:hypothetical protein
LQVIFIPPSIFSIIIVQRGIIIILGMPPDIIPGIVMPPMPIMFMGVDIIERSIAIIVSIAVLLVSR